MPIKLNGATSGYIELAAPAVAGTTTLTLPTDSIKPGMVLIAEQSFSAASSVSFNNCFSSIYQNYLLITSVKGTGSGNLLFRYRASGLDDSASNHAYQNFEASSTSVGGTRSTSQTSFRLGNIRVDNPPSLMETLLTNPFDSSQKTYKSDNADPSAGGLVVMYYGTKDVTTSFDGFSIFPSSGTITGTLRVYGYRNSL